MGKQVWFVYDGEVYEATVLSINKEYGRAVIESCVEEYGEYHIVPTSELHETYQSACKEAIDSLTKSQRRCYEEIAAATNKIAGLLGRLAEQSK